MNIEGITEEICNVRNLHDLALTLNKEELIKLINKLTVIAHEKMEKHEESVKNEDFIHQKEEEKIAKIHILDCIMNEGKQSINNHSLNHDIETEQNLNCPTKKGSQNNFINLHEDIYNHCLKEQQSSIQICHSTTHISNVSKQSLKNNKLNHPNDPRVTSALSSSSFHEGYDDLFDMDHDISFENVYKSSIGNHHETSIIFKEYHSFEEEDYSQFFHFCADEKNKNFIVDYEKFLKNRPENDNNKDFGHEDHDMEFINFAPL